MASLLVAAHLHHEYWPRERTARPTADGAATAAWLASELPYRLWIAHPHQNLGRLRRDPRFRQAAGLLPAAGLPAVELPSFGPLAAPPARAMTLAADRDGRRAMLVAEVYPLARWLGRLAGLVAGNPWLTGGRVENGGRVVEIAWRDGAWVVTSGLAGPAAGGGGPAPAARPPSEPALAYLALADGAGWLPAGAYRLARDGPDLALTGGDAAAAAALAAPPMAGVALVAAAGGEGRFDALALAAADSGLPAAAVLHRGAGRPWELPGEGLYELLGRRLERRDVAGWRLLATSGTGAALGADLAPRLAARVEGELAFGLWVDLPATAVALGPLATQLARLPVGDARRWAAAAEAVTALAAWERFSLAVVAGPRPGVHARLWSRPAG